MPALDDHLRNELRRTVRPVDVNDVSTKIDVRRTRRVRLRKIQALALTVVVLTGTISGFAFLSRAFRDPGVEIGVQPSMANGAIVYARVSGDLQHRSQHLWIVEPDGSGRQLTSEVDAGGTTETYPDVSPDGKTVVFVASRSDGTIGLYTVLIDSGQVRPLTIPATSGTQPTWSPDGTQVAFVGRDASTAGLFVVNADGSDARVIDTGLRGVNWPTWTPDGSRIVFSAGEGSGPHDLYSIRPTGSELVRITDTPDVSETQPDVSPDGSTIVFAAQTGSGVGTRASLFLMNAEGSNVRALTESPAIDGRSSWSPDGALIAFERYDGASDDSIFTIRSDGTGLKEIVSGSAPAWQPLPVTSDSSVPTPSTRESGPIDMGLGFPVCNVLSMSADFDGNGTPDTASVATKMSDVGGCPAPGTSTEVLVVDLNGDGKADASGGPLACPTGCEPFAAPDVDGDGLPEIAIVVDRANDGTKRIQLWNLTTPPGGSLAVIPFLDPKGDPATFGWGTVNNWGGDGPEVFGVSCTSRTSPPLVTEWQAIPTGPDSWHISEHGYHVVGTELRSSFEDSYDVPGEETVFPDGGGDTMCGAPVQSTG